MRILLWNSQGLVNVINNEEQEDIDEAALTRHGMSGNNPEEFLSNLGTISLRGLSLLGKVT